MSYDRRYKRILSGFHPKLSDTTEMIFSGNEREKQVCKYM